MKKYLVALDQGTTSSRAIVFDRSQQIVASAQKEFPQLYPQAGWVEHDPLELYSSQYGVMMEAITRGGIDPAEIAAIGITNQRETTIVWEKATGRPIYPAIVWQCRRTAALCDRLRADGLTEHIRAVTGLVPDAYFSATKIRWILDHVPGAQERAERGELLFGTVDSWLVWKLTRGRVHATDVTNASRTMLFDIRRLDWDETLLQVLRIPRCMLPDVRPSSGDFGTCNIQGVEIPIAGAAGDQQAALFGQCCFAPGEAKNTYGTGCFLLMNTGETPCVSRHGLVTTIAAGLGGHVTYALEGSVFVGGLASFSAYSSFAQSRLLPTAFAQPRRFFSRCSAVICGRKLTSHRHWRRSSSGSCQMPTASPARYAAPRAVVSRMTGRRTGVASMSAWNCMRKASRLAPPSTRSSRSGTPVSFSMAATRSMLW